MDRVNQQLEQIEPIVAAIRSKPKPATDWRLRFDGFYPGYVKAHQEFSAQQQHAYQNKKSLRLIEITEQKTAKIIAYMKEARRNLYSNDYKKIEEIIKNDERMLNYLKCDLILSHKNNHLEHERALYLSCLKNFDQIKEQIKAINSPTPHEPQSRVIEHSYESELKPKSKQENDSNFDLDF